MLKTLESENLAARRRRLFGWGGLEAVMYAITMRMVKLEAKGTRKHFSSAKTDR